MSLLVSFQDSTVTFNSNMKYEFLIGFSMSLSRTNGQCFRITQRNRTNTIICARLATNWTKTYPNGATILKRQNPAQNKIYTIENAEMWEFNSWSLYHILRSISLNIYLYELIMFYLKHTVKDATNIRIIYIFTPFLCIAIKLLSHEHTKRKKSWLVM